MREVILLCFFFPVSVCINDFEKNKSVFKKNERVTIQATISIAKKVLSCENCEVNFHSPGMAYVIGRVVSSMIGNYLFFEIMNFYLLNEK